MKLEKVYPDMIRSEPLKDVKYYSKERNDGHSLFYYELNVVHSRVNGKTEILYNYNKNTINDMNSSPFVNFDFNFSPISVEY